jgi:rSAM/selenodomain-associated transferase 2
MSIAVIIPVLNEQDTVPSLLRALLPAGFEEIVLVDGGSSDRTVETAMALLHSAGDSRYRLISGPCGRAFQMNAGAAVATSDILLFLHADTRLPDKGKQAVEREMADVRCVGGRFNVRFPDDTGYAWMVSRLMNLRSRLSGIATGDQAMFVRRSVFERMGGFADLPLMEDVEFSRRLKRMGPLVFLHDYVVTSFRRWEQHGPLRTILRMWCLRLFYWLGCDPHHLHHYYDPVR